MMSVHITAPSPKNKLSKDTKYYIHSLIGITLMFGIGFLPPLEPITPLGMKFLGILIGLIYLWSLVEMLWPSVLGLVAIILTGQATGASITPQAFGTEMIWLVVLSMAVVFSLTGTGMFDYVTNWVLTRKSLSGRPWLLSTAIIFGYYFVAVLGGGLAVMFLLWELIYAIADRAGMKRTHPWCGAMVVGLVMAFVNGGATLPFKPNYIFVVGTFQRMTGMPDIPMTSALVMNPGIFIALLGFYLLLVRFVLRPDVSSMKNVDASVFVKPLPPMNKRQKFAACYLIAFIVGLMLPGTVALFSQGAIAQTLQALGTTGMCYLFFAFLCIVRLDGEPILVFSQITKQIQWDSVFLMGIAFTLSPMLTAEETGISAMAMKLVNPILGGQSTYLFVVMMFLITLVMTNIANNTVVMMIMMTVIASFLSVLDLNLPTIALLMTPMAQTAFLLPASSFYGALVYSQASHIGTKNIYKSAALTMIAAVLMMLVVGIPLGSLLF